MQEYQYIVIVYQGSIPLNIWDDIKIFDMILLVNGSPLEQESLIKANIMNASKAAILGHDPTLKPNLQSEMLDAQSIFIYKAIKKLNPELQIITELVYNSNIDFLLPKKNKYIDYTLSTLYASGEVYISSIVDTITAQSFYNPHIVTLLNLILKGTDRSKKLNKFMKSFNNLTQSNLWQIPAPEGLYNKTFNDLFLFLLDRNLVALGLYRLAGASDNKSPYVFTNPNGTTITKHDKVFVLGEKIPKDLSVNIEEYNDNINSEDFKNQYNFGLKAEGEIVEDYYGNEINNEHNLKSNTDSDSEETIISKNIKSKQEFK